MLSKPCGNHKAYVYAYTHKNTKKYRKKSKHVTAKRQLNTQDSSNDGKETKKL